MSVVHYCMFFFIPLINCSLEICAELLHLICALLCSGHLGVSDKFLVLRVRLGVATEAAQDLDQDRHKDDGAVCNANHGAIETVEEADVSVDLGRLTQCVAESARAALDFIAVDRA